MNQQRAGLVDASATTEFISEAKKDWTLLVVTHDAGELLAIADQCWTLNHGQLHATPYYFAAKLTLRTTLEMAAGSQP